MTTKEVEKKMLIKKEHKFLRNIFEKNKLKDRKDLRVMQSFVKIFLVLHHIWQYKEDNFYQIVDENNFFAEQATHNVLILETYSNKLKALRIRNISTMLM